MPTTILRGRDFETAAADVKPRLNPAINTELALHAKVRNSTVIALQERRRVILRDLYDLRVLCDEPNDVARDWSHELLVIDTELVGRGVIPTPRPM